MIRKPLYELQERKSFYCNGSTSLLLLNDGRIASSEFDTIQIYDINKLNELVMSIPIQYIEFNKMYELDDNVLISFSNSNIISCWKINQTTYEPLFSEDQNEKVNFFIFNDNEHFATISNNSFKLQIFSSKPPHNQSPIREKVINSTKFMKFGVGLKGLPLFLICKEEQLDVYSTITFQCRSTIVSKLLIGIYEEPFLQYNNETVILVSCLHMVLVNVVNGVIEKQLFYGGIGLILFSITKLSDDFLFCGGQYGRCLIYNVSTGYQALRQVDNIHQVTKDLLTSKDNSIVVALTKSQIIVYDVKIFQLKDRYVSEVKENNNEVGVCYYNNGDKYIGEYTVKYFEYKDKEIYTFTKGKYIYIKRNGFGIMKYKNGDTIIGEWINDKLNGYGKILKNNGKCYLGEFTDGELNGFGIKKERHIYRYVGEWKKNKRQGYGSNYYKNLKEYHGQFYNGLREGYGTLLSANAYKYEGHWKYNEKDGDGIETFPHKTCETKKKKKKCLIF